MGLLLSKSIIIFKKNFLDYIMLEAGIISLIVATAGATVALIVKFALLSKCDSVNLCWGCCAIHRNTSQEVQQPSSPERISNV